MYDVLNSFVIDRNYMNLYNKNKYSDRKKAYTHYFVCVCSKIDIEFLWPLRIAKAFDPLLV